MTPKDEAQIGPRQLKDPNSVAYAWQTVALLQTMWESLSCSQKQWEDVVAQAEQHRIYERIPPQKPYGSLDAMLLAEIGVSPEEAIEVVKHRAEKTKKARAHRRPTKEEQVNKPDNVRFKSEYGNSADYLTARIARDRPDVLDRMKAGEFKSVRAAAKVAGLVEERITIPRHPERAARLIRKHFTPDQIAALIRALEAVP